MSDTITITQTLTVSDNDCHNILTTALEGGYMEEFEVLDCSRLADGLVTRMLVTCPDADGTEGWDGLPVEIDAGKIREGLVKFAQWIAVSDPGCKSYLGEQWSEGLQEGWGYLDAIGADAVLQFAVFGEVIFS